MIFDWKTYTGSLSWLPERTIYLTRHGSHAYGTSLPTSDIDIRGVAIAPKEYYHGLTQVFKIAEQKEPDLVIFEVKKFLKLASESNPNVLELLYTEPEDHLWVTPLGEKLLDSREIFLSRRIKHTFSGYAISQLRRINTHYRWLKHPPVHAPGRAGFGLPERTVIPADQLAAANSAIKKKMDEWSWHEMENVDPDTRQAVQDEFQRRLSEITSWEWDEIETKTWQSAANSLGFDTNFLVHLDRERMYNNAMREWQQYQKWKEERNPARAALEEKFGYDTKHAMHLVRLMRMCREVLIEGKVRVRRPDAEDLLAIRAGSWTYEELIAWAKNQDLELNAVMESSPLPWGPDYKKIEALCIDLVEGSFETPKQSIVEGIFEDWK
jgi:predicted nucleotidyltransferase